MCCGAASGEGTGGRAALMTDITSKKNQSREWRSLSFFLQFGIMPPHCSITCCGESVLESEDGTLYGSK